MLHAEVDGAGPRLVLVHGFTQTRRSWGPVGRDLARDHEVVRVDAPGHGRSAPVAAGLPGAGRLVAEVGGPATYLGYSMGGRICLHTALERPDVVRRLVLVGATGGIDDPAERAARVQADEELAAGLERDGLDAFLERWLALPLFAGLSAEAADPGARRENTVAGLAASLRTGGTGTQAPLWDRVGAIDVPTLVVVGALDAKFAAAGQRLVAGIGSNATYVEVPGAGHTAHLEQPGPFLSLLRAWLADHPA